MARWIADLEGLRRYWGHDAWIVGGHSFGAALALAYAVEYPAHTRAVIYFSCVLAFGDHADCYDVYRRNRLARIPSHQRARFLELRERRGTGDIEHQRVEREYAALVGPTDFGDAATARALLNELRAAERPANREVNRTLGADFQRYFGRARFREQLARLRLPVLLLRGEADPRPVEATEYLAAQISGSRFIRLPRVGHYPWLEAPEAFARALRDFVSTP